MIFFIVRMETKLNGLKNMENKKIKNAQKKTVDNIQFKSVLESVCYKHLAKTTLKFAYEPKKFTIWRGETLKNTKVYLHNANRRNLEEPRSNKARDITYTPDFIIEYKEYTIYVDVKGFTNDVYPLKRKMFLQHIDSMENTMFFEPHNVSEILSMINIIQKL